MDYGVGRIDIFFVKFIVLEYFVDVISDGVVL